MSEPDPVAALVARVLEGRKYRSLLPALVEHVARRELEVRPDAREALKATRRRLHQVVGAYRGRLDVRRACAALEASADPATLRETCARLLALHASTRERQRVLDPFYAALFERLGRVESVMDVACGLHPLALPWMPLDPAVPYLACDVDQGLLEVVQALFAARGQAGRVQALDASAEVPAESADVAFLLKCLPCLEQLSRGTTERLLRELPARRLVVSFPDHSLGGRKRGLGEAHERELEARIAALGWRAERFAVPGEVVVLVEKPLS